MFKRTYGVVLLLATSLLQAQSVTVPIAVTVTQPTTSAAGSVVINGQTVTIPKLTPTCGAQPATTTATQSCPTGYTGSWQQTTSYVSASAPQCWTAVLSPTTAPTNACTPVVVVTPPPTNPTPPVSDGRCGLGAAVAFCDTFEEIPVFKGRAGELNQRDWSVGRLSGDISSSGQGTANPTIVGVPTPGVFCTGRFDGTDYFPPNDTFLCDPTSTRSAQLMTITSIQNYGNNSYMIRRPFDFAGRTGRVVFDVDAVANGLGGYVEIDITDEAVPAPNFREFNNFEAGGSVPKNAVVVKLLGTCTSGVDIAPSNTMVYKNYIGTIVTPSFDHKNGCAKVKQGLLSHFEIQLSQTSISVYGSDFSSDGVNFPNFKLLYTAPVALSFTRGYVHIAARNHATLKYSLGQSAVYHWDNVGFDGPVLERPRAYEVADNNTRLMWNPAGSAPTALPAMNLGYQLKTAGVFDPVKILPNLVFSGVDLTGIGATTYATMTMNIFYNTGGHVPDTTWGFSYKFNGKTAHVVNVTQDQITGASDKSLGPQLVLGLAVPVDLSELVSGDNVVEFLPVNAPQDYPPVIANLDILLANRVTP